jgi:hypothetical protein
MKGIFKIQGEQNRRRYSIHKLVSNKVNSRIWKIKEDYREAYTKNLQRDFYGTQK